MALLRPRCAARVAADDQDRYLAGPRLRPGHELRPGLDVSDGTFLFPGVPQLSLVVLLGRERRLLVTERLHADVPEDDRDPYARAERTGLALGSLGPVALHKQVHDTADRDRQRRAHAHQDPQGATP